MDAVCRPNSRASFAVRQLPGAAVDGSNAPIRPTIDTFFEPTSLLQDVDFMSTVLDPDTITDLGASPAQRLRIEMAAVRVSFSWLGTRKALTAQQKAQAAESFGAEGGFLSAGKKLLDTRHPRFKAVTAIRNRALCYWKGVSLPYPEPGIRLIRQHALDEFNDKFAVFGQELTEAVDALDEHYAALKSSARKRLGELFCEADYPESLQNTFAISWDFPSVEPPDYLRQLRPELYEQECRRVANRFDEAVQLAESAFMEELGGLISHLTERLSGSADGKPQVFRDSAVGNLRDFFDRFRQLNVRSNDQLDRLVEQCQQVVQGVDPQALREDTPLRNRVSGQLAGVQSVLDGLLVDRPRRRIIRRAN
jgi:hypothetical protein